MKKEMIQFGLIDYHHHYFHFLRIILHLVLKVLLDFDLIKVKDYIYTLWFFQIIKIDFITNN